MCDFCASILGRGGFPHTQKDCALKQSAHCPLCGPGTHFRNACPKKGKPLAPLAKPVASLPPPKQPNHLFMADTNQGYCEYLRQNELPVERKQADNRAAVQRHLMTLDPPLLLVNPPVPKPTPAQETAPNPIKKKKLIVE